MPGHLTGGAKVKLQILQRNILAAYGNIRLFIIMTWSHDSGYWTTG